MNMLLAELNVLRLCLITIEIEENVRLRFNLICAICNLESFQWVSKEV